MGAILNGQPRRTVRSRRSSSIIAQAIAILARYGGSLWVSDPAYTFTGSDGTGAAGDGSDAGYVRDLCGNARPLTQATTGFKPKLRRVPKKLGPELAPATTSTTGWAAAGGGVISSDGTALTITNGAAAESRAQFAAAFKANTSYAVSLEVTALVNGGSGAFIIGSTRVGLGGLGSKSLMLTPTIAAAEGRVAPNSGTLGDGVTFKNISVREVLEWTWAWVFDGVDDILYTASLPAGTDETIMVCATSLTSAGTARAPIGKRSSNNGLFIRRESGGSLNGNAMTGSGFGSMALENPHVNFSPFVATVSAKSGASRGRLDGAQKATTAGVYAGWAGPLGVGSEKGTDSGTQWSGYVFAAAYIPGTPTDAELLLVERAMAQLAGVTF